MFTPKRTIDLQQSNSARLTRSQSLKLQNEPISPGGNSGGLNKTSLNLGLIYNDCILQSYKAPLPIKVNELIARMKSQGIIS